VILQCPNVIGIDISHSSILSSGQPRFFPSFSDQHIEGFSVVDHMIRSEVLPPSLSASMQRRIGEEGCIMLRS
jgi:hypothetical protein